MLIQKSTARPDLYSTKISGRARPRLSVFIWSVIYLSFGSILKYSLKLNAYSTSTKSRIIELTAFSSMISDITFGSSPSSIYENSESIAFNRPGFFFGVSLILSKYISGSKPYSKPYGDRLNEFEKLPMWRKASMGRKDSTGMFAILSVSPSQMASQTFLIYFSISARRKTFTYSSSYVSFGNSSPRATSPISSLNSPTVGFFALGFTLRISTISSSSNPTSIRSRFTGDSNPK